MNRIEAASILRGYLEQYRARSYDRLKQLVGSPQTDEMVGPSGTHYQIEVQLFPDDRHSGNLRVLGAIDGGGISSFRPLTDDFIMAPDGSFVGE